MGILRTDKISGLETPTAVTGSVYFDGNNDYLQITSADAFAYGTGDFTWEVWAWLESTSDRGYIFDHGSDEGALNFTNTTPPKITYYNSTTGTSGSLYNDIGDAPRDSWNHIAVVRNSGVTKVFVNGVEKASQADTHNYNTTTLTIGMYGGGVGTPGGTNWWDGYISNVRILKGRALYTTDFTPPVHALEPIDGTVLLCCNNSDSAGAASNAGIGTAHVVSVSSATVSTFSPGLTRDFTSGTEFRGVTTFDTQGYFVPPSGTTTDRDRTGGRGVIKGGDNAITYISISSQGNTKDFGDLTVQAENTSACSSSTRGLFSAGYNHPSYYKIIDFVTIATTGDATSFGEITTSDSYVYGMGGCSSSTRGLFAGGSAPSTSSLDTITYVTIASLGNSQNFGDLTDGVRYPSGTSSPIRGIFGGGRDNSGNKNVMSYITIATTGDATDFGDLTYSPYSQASTGSSTRGMTMGGANPAGSAAYDNIDYFTIATTGNTQDFGNLTVARSGLAATSNAVRGTFAGGNTVPSNVNHIDYVTIASTGDATNFGDLSSSSGSNSACSDSHGGIS